MHNSQEELIELEELKPSHREKPKNTNKIDLSPLNSSTSACTAGEDANIVSIFSVTPRRKKTEPTNSVRTVSEISDDVFVGKAETTSASRKGNVKTYKQKISEHIKKIKEKAGTPYKNVSSKLSKVTRPLEKVRRESENMDAELESFRTKFKLKEATSSAQERENFFSFIKEQKEQIEETVDGNDVKTTKNMAYYALPEQLIFNINLSENDWFFTPSRKKLDPNTKLGNVESRCLEEYQPEKNIPKISQGEINLIERRLLSVEDKKWFDNEGNLNILENPITSDHFRPNRLISDVKMTDYKPATTKEECNEIVIVRNKILDLNVSQLTFSYHPLFSIEHVFAEKLKSLYQIHVNNAGESGSDALKQQLDKLRVKRNQLQNLKNQSGDSNLITVVNIEKEIKNVRNKYFEASEKQRNNLKSMLETWKQIKRIRQHQKYSNTNLRLVIKKEQVELEVETELYDQELERTLKEIINEHQTEFMVQDTIQDAEDIDKTNSESKDESKIKPAEINEEKIRQQLVKKMKKCFKPPGEPILKFTLTENNDITEDVTNSKETTRRNVVASTKIYLRILCNNIEACKSKMLCLNDAFSIDINESFSLQLTDIPKYLSVEIIEQPKLLLKKRVCELHLNIPSLTSTGVGKICTKTFEKKEIVHYKHEGLGSGIDLKTVAEKANLTISNKDNFELRTEGYLQYYMEWEKLYQNETVTNLQSEFALLDQIIDKNFVIDVAKMKDFSRSLNEEDDQSVEYLERINENKHCRLNRHTQELNFCNITEIEQNIRLKVLQLRDKKEIEFDGMLVPNRIKEIPFNILSDYKRRKAVEGKGYFVEDDEDDDNFEVQRNFGKKYLKQVHIKIFQLCKTTENNLDYESVVNERYLIYFHIIIKTLLRNLLNWFRWQPKISKPLPLLAKKSETEEIFNITNASYITIVVVGAKNVPNRAKSTFNNSESTTENEVRPFVTVSYKNVTVRIPSSSGTNPVWNETLTVPLESSHTDYLNPNSLDGHIVVDLFDESDMQIKKLNKQCTNWLGQVQISLSAISYCDSMKGLFKVRRPHLLLGYEVEGETINMKSPKMNKAQSYHQTYLQMEISIKPNIPKLAPNMEELPCGDLPYIHEHIIKWNNAYNCSFPNRKFSALAIDTNGKTTCVTRYIRHLEPPQINMEEFDVTAEQCMRFVSLIPFTECNHFYSNIWLSTDQLLKMMIGSVTDHAGALTCYLLALKMEVWLLLGYAIPHGPTAFVLVKEYSADVGLPVYYVLDVLYNEKYNLSDENCPLQKIYCLINGSNIWGNTQNSDNIPLTRFDLNRKSDWLPLFNNHISAPVNFVTKKLLYRPKQDVENLELALERKIKKQISKLRQLDRTIWNSSISKVFESVLRSFEMNCMFNKNQLETMNEMHESISSHNVTGFAINISFTNISRITKRIKSLEIHVQDENTEFAVAVYIHPYPAHLWSVWVFIGTVKVINEYSLD